jgi:multidrug efflux pump subunit AcrA (membrane-fusion protein)
MNRGKTYSFTIALLASAALVTNACSSGDAKAREQNSSAPVVSVSAVAAVERPIARFIRATGSLMAEEQADVAAETAGRVVSANIERGSAVS